MGSSVAEVATLFSTPVVKINIDREFTEDEVDCLQNIPIHKNPNTMMNHRSVDSFLFDNFAKELKDIKNFCEGRLTQYLEEIEGIDTDLATLRITQSWLNKNKPQESHHPHTHKNSYLSGVFYFKCLPNDEIHFESQTLGLLKSMVFSRKKITLWNSNVATINVKEGDLILFPSYLRHFVNPNKTKDKERISLSFNTFPIGEMGDYDGATYLKL